MPNLKDTRLIYYNESNFTIFGVIVRPDVSIEELYFLMQSDSVDSE